MAVREAATTRSFKRYRHWRGAITRASGDGTYSVPVRFMKGGISRMVFVIGMNGKRLMPTTERKARLLLKSNKAEVYSYRPFAIRLLYKTGTTTQDIRRGVDTGSQHIGISVVSTDDTGRKVSVLYKAEISLRTTMEKKSLMDTRREYRRGRRYRNTRYRKPKWKHKTIRKYNPVPDKKGRHWHKSPPAYKSNRKDGWLPPSVDQKVQHHIDWIRRIDILLPGDVKGIIEVGRFDMARMQDPTIHNEMYQYGPMYDFENVKAYVFDRDGYRCKICHAKAGSMRSDGSVVKLKAHHIDFRSKGSTDNPKRMASVCDRCHTFEAHQPGGILYKWMVKDKKFSQGLRDATFMNILRRRIWAAFLDDKFTYGNITNADRKCIGLPKNHSNDAIAIACMGLHDITVRDNVCTDYWQQQRKKKRSLHEANPRKGRKEPNRLAVRNNKNTKQITSGGKTYCLLDKVAVGDRTGWITGFTGNAAYIKDKDNAYITVSEKYKQVNLSSVRVLKHNNNWLLGPVAHLGKAE